MTFLNEASKLLTNKYFLYFISFLAATNVLGYLVTNNLNAVTFFLLVSLITYQFSKNMTVILLIAIISTNFLMVNKNMREGLENKESVEPPKTDNQSLSKIANTDPQIDKAIKLIEKSKNEEDVRAQLKEDVVSADVDTENVKITDLNNPGLNKSDETPGPKGVGEKISKTKNSIKSEHFGPRLDYAATIEQSYQNLDNILGSDSIKQLTNDTQKLMAQQQNLFNTMNQMVPVLKGAQDMLKGFNMNELTKSLGNMSDLTKAPTVLDNK